MGTGTPVLTGEDITAEKMNLKLESLNDSNLLAGLTPVMSGWIQEPGTLKEIADELVNSLTIQGITNPAARTIVKYDLGASKRVSVNLTITIGGFISGTPILECSDDDINYFTVINIVNIVPGWFYSETVTVKARYVQLLLDGEELTFLRLGLRAYLL